VSSELNLPHNDSTFTTPGATLEKGQIKIRNEHRKRAKDLGADLHATSPVQRGPIQAGLSEFLPRSSDSITKLPLTSASSWTSPPASSPWSTYLTSMLTSLKPKPPTLA